MRGGDKQIGKAKATWRAMLKRKPIEQLERSLKQREDVLDKVLNQDTNASVQGLREEIRKQGVSNRESVDRLSARMASLSVAHTRQVAVAERNIHRRFDRAERQTKQMGDDLARQTTHMRNELLQRQDHERFLSSLFFPEIDQRRSTVKDAYPGTLEWIFDEPDETAANRRPWASFASWLRSDDDSVYWVSGKGRLRQVGPHGSHTGGQTHESRAYRSGLKGHTFTGTLILLLEAGFRSPEKCARSVAELAVPALPCNTICC